MSEMVERVARAMVLAGQPHLTTGGWTEGEIRELVDVLWREMEPEARAAIAAMREPTDALIQAGLTGTIWNYNDTHAEANKEHPFYVSARKGQAKAWRAMIDEALK